MPALIVVVAAATLFVGMLAVAEVGRRIGRVRLAHDPESLSQGSGAAEAAVLGLLGLLIAFTFSGAALRFEDRRHLVTEEANAIGTAYFRLDLLPHDARREIQELFRRYVEIRSTAYRDVRDRNTTQAKLDEGTALQKDIWTMAMAAFQRPDAPAHAAMLLVPALNEMIDITTSRAMATRNHPPLVVFLLLVGASLVGALVVGFGTAANRDRRWFHTMIFAAMLSLTVYVIVDLEFPRLGLIRVDAADEILVELRRSME